MKDEPQVSNESGADAASRPVHSQTGPFPALPPDPHDPNYRDVGDDEKTNIHDYGLNEEVTVGHNGSAHDYGTKE